MEEQAYNVISLPGIDLPYYFDHSLSFIGDNYPAFFEILKSTLGIIIGLSIPVSLFLLIGIIISVEGIKHVRTKEDEIYNAKVVMAFTEENTDSDLGKRWDNVLKHSQSGNENDWRQAIIEADIILDELVTKLGYKGEGLGEKLKRAVKGDFKSLDQAWEAHKVRNMIAHSGSDFSLNQVEVNRVINLYRQVFEEFYHISG